MILHGDCLERMQELADNSIDSVITDPPYGLSFMGKKWDYDVPSVAIWREVFRVLRPGGHLLCFGGARTYHRMVVSVEDAGFEIRDQIQWIYGSGFPKSHDVSKAIDKLHGMEREIVGYRDAKGSVHGNAAPDSTGSHKYSGELRSAEPVTDHAIKWQGFGSALKPAHEPICLARKPLEHSHTIASNVLKHGTGALNIDASRIEAADQAVLDAAVKRMTGNAAVGWKNTSSNGIQPKSSQGRWPANLILGCACEGDIHDAECPVGMLDAQSGVTTSGGNINRKGGFNPQYVGGDSNHGNKVTTSLERGTGGASRFFYVAKASKRERNAGLDGMPEKRIKAYEGGDIASAKTPDSPGGKRTAQNHHPTVKPIRLMEYLIRLITPHGGRVLDPFAGSGSTGVACKRLGFEFIGIELDEAYAEIAVKRIEACI